VSEEREVHVREATFVNQYRRGAWYLTPKINGFLREAGRLWKKLEKFLFMFY
jgi:hypothetical protein